MPRPAQQISGRVGAPVLKVPSGKAQESSLNAEPSVTAMVKTNLQNIAPRLFHPQKRIWKLSHYRFLPKARKGLPSACRGKVAFSGSIRAACKHGMPMQWSELPERKTIIQQRLSASTSMFLSWFIRMLWPFFSDRRVISWSAFPFPYPRFDFSLGGYCINRLYSVSTALETVGEMLWSPLRKSSLTGRKEQESSTRVIVLLE